MRRALISLLAGLSILVGSQAVAKFGMSKTRVTLPRLHPPESPLMAETVAVEVKGDSRDVAGAHAALVRGRLEDALRAMRVYEVVDRPREADAVVRVLLSDLRAEVRDEIRMESKNVKIGERQEWDAKKNKMVTKDVYGYREQPVSWRVADGSLTAAVEVDGKGGHRTRDADSSYHQAFKVESGVPPEARSEEDLRRFLVLGAAQRAIAAVAYSPDPVEALLAVDGELKPGNNLAEAGRFREALEEWSRLALKGDKEAARLHNLGVAHEALAYLLPPHDPEHRSHLDQAQDHYRRARERDPDEKHFKEPLPRIEESLSYSATAASFRAELERFHQENRRRAEAPPEPRRRASTTDDDKAPARPRTARGERPAEAGPAATGSASTSIPLRNGSFESSLAPWTIAGKGTIVQEAGRGRVFEAAAGAGQTTVRQEIGVSLEGATAASLSLDYKVASGEGVIRVMVGYADASGRDRTSTLEVTGGETAGGWSPWTGDLATLRPRPSRVKDVRIVIEGGTVRIDNVAVTIK